MNKEQVTEKILFYQDRLALLDRSLMDPIYIKQFNKLKELNIEADKINNILSCLIGFRNKLDEINDLKSLGSQDPLMSEYFDEELISLSNELESLSNKIKKLLTPPNPYFNRNILLEIRAGVGGEEAGIFAKELFKMYSKFCEKNNIHFEIVSIYEKEFISLLKGNDAFNLLRFESGNHRVQRIPTTETKGRIQTSTVTVAILPEPTEIEVNLQMKDLRIDTMRAGGPGGQSVNTTDSAVRIVHIPTQTTVVCMDEKSQHDNKDKAMRVLKARILEKQIDEQKKKEVLERKNMIGSGKRAEHIRTYNFPQNRVTDHRINISLYDIDSFMNGNIAELSGKLLDDYNKQIIENKDN